MKPRLLTAYELFSLQALYAGAYAGLIYPSLIINSTIGPLWIPILIWAAASAASGLLYMRLVLQLNGQSMIPFAAGLIGKPIALLLMLPVLLFIFGALTVMLRSYTELVSMTLLPTTPMPFMNGMILVPAGLAMAGIMPIIRSARVLLLLALGMIVLLLAVGVSGTRWELAGPWIGPTWDFFAKRDFYGGSFVWMGCIYIAIIVPFSSKQAKLFQKSFWLALAMTVLLVVSFIYIPVMTFGREMSRALSFPFVSKMDSIYQYWIIFENLTAVFLSAALMCILLILALKLKSIECILKGIWPKLSSKWIIMISAAIVFFISLLIPEWRNIERWLFNSAFLRLYAMFVFPAALFAAIYIKQGKAGKS